MEISHVYWGLCYLLVISRSLRGIIELFLFATLAETG